MGCATSKADEEAAASPPPQAGAPTKAAADTAAAPAQTSTGPSTASPFANAPADHQQVGGAARQDDELGEARSIEWNALDRPSMPALKGNSHSYRRTSTDSKVGFAVSGRMASTSLHVARAAWHCTAGISVRTSHLLFACVWHVVNVHYLHEAVGAGCLACACRWTLRQRLALSAAPAGSPFK